MRGGRRHSTIARKLTADIKHITQTVDRFGVRPQADDHPALLFHPRIVQTQNFNLKAALCEQCGGLIAQVNLQALKLRFRHTAGHANR